MEYDILQTLEKFVKSPEAVYIGIGVGGAFLGYIARGVFSRKKLKFAEIERDKVVSQQEAKKAECKAREFEAENAVKRLEHEKAVTIKKLELEENDRQHKRGLELMAKKREYELEDKEREANEKKQRREYRLQLADRLKDLRPVVNEYLDKIKDAQQPIREDLIEKREGFRLELIETYLERLDNDIEDICDSEYDISEEDKERINRLVDAKFPIDNVIQTQVPPEIKSLVNLLFDDE